VSHIDVVKFNDRVIEDATFQAKLREIRMTNEDEAMKKLIQIAAHYGYSFTEGDIEDLCLLMAVTEVQNETGREIRQEKLKLLINDSSILQATRATQKMNIQFYMQYLILQQRMQEENRQFQTISNIMKAKHDIAMNIINNLR
jgi:CRISPR/Cas system-associated endonuclease/helicase Cas3